MFYQPGPSDTLRSFFGLRHCDSQLRERHKAHTCPLQHKCSILVPLRMKRNGKAINATMAYDSWLTYLSLTKEYINNRSSMNFFHSGFSFARSLQLSLDTIIPSDSKASFTMNRSSQHTTRLPWTRREGVNTRIFSFSSFRRISWSAITQGRNSGVNTW